MIAEGRTTHEAVVAGTLYQVKGENWGKYGAMFPAAETPREAAEMLLSCLAQYDRVCPLHGERLEVRKVLSATVGCTVIESEPFVYHVNHGGLL